MTPYKQIKQLQEQNRKLQRELITRDITNGWNDNVSQTSTFLGLAPSLPGPSGSDSIHNHMTAQVHITQGSIRGRP